MPHAPSDHPVDDLLASLADWRRRAALEFLMTREGPVAVEAVAAAVAEGVDGADADERRLTIRLHHRHLPALDDAGLVEYDPGTRTVRYRGGERVEALLGLLDDALADAAGADGQREADGDGDGDGGPDDGE